MNIYTARFWATCPANGLSIDYLLQIQTGQMIRVEQLLQALGKITEGYHEAIADQLLEQFGGTQTLRADHHGVLIETIRPHIAHWSKPNEAEL